MTFNYDRDEENYYSANMIQVELDRLDENLEEVDRLNEAHPSLLHHFAMAGRAVSLETDGFTNNTNPVILDGACTNIKRNHPGHFVGLNFQIDGYVQIGDYSWIPVRGFGTVNIWNTDDTAHPYQLKDCCMYQI